MSALKPAPIKKLGKQGREHQVLLGLVELYLKTGKPIGSNTLREAGFEGLSSATIRNYFSRLEEEGFLAQQHTSGGRVPTHKAFRVYASAYSSESFDTKRYFQDQSQEETKEIALYLQRAAENLCSLTQTPVFLSAPRFDNDYIIDLKLIPIDSSRCLCVIITDFGVVRTEILPIDEKLSTFTAKRIEHYFHWRLTGLDEPLELELGEKQLAQKLYNEIAVRYIVAYSNFIDSELYRTGLSKLLNYPEFFDPNALSNSLALFENTQTVRLLIKECCKVNHLKFWIGDDLEHYSPTTSQCSVIAIPYHISHTTAGAVGILGPTRIPYRELFHILHDFAFSITEALTRNLYKYKITFRQPQTKAEDMMRIDHNLFLLEDKFSQNKE